VDGTEDERIWLLDTGETMYFDYKIANPSDCYSFSIVIRALSGDPDMYISFSSTNPRPTADDADLVSQRPGSDSLRACCETSFIIDQNPPWDGRIFFTIYAFARTQFQIDIISDTRLNATDFYYVPMLQIECDGVTVLSTTECENTYCLTLPPTEDPLFSRQAQLTGLDIPNNYQLKQISIALSTQTVRFTSASTSSTSFLFNTSILNDPTCFYSFPNMITLTGEVFAGTSKMSRRALGCSKESFDKSAEGIDDLVSQLSTLSTSAVDSVNQFLYRATAFTVADWWLGCVQMIERSLLTSESQLQTINNTQSCFATDPTSAEYLQDPCCNPQLQSTMCCASRSVTTSARTFSINSDAVANTCRFSNCSTQLLRDYMVLADASGTVTTNCVQETIRALNDPLFIQNPLESCQESVYQTICSVNDDCFTAMGTRNTVCLGVGWCTVPCETNEDCLTGRCDVVLDDKTCLLYDPYERNDTIFAQSNALLIDCLNDNMNNYVNLFIRQELGLNSSSTDEEYQERFFTTLVENGCQGVGLITNEQLTNRELCEETRMCNWAFCNDLEDSDCTLENCLDPLINRGDYYCEACFGQNDCFESSSFAHCEYVTYGTPAQCVSFGGHINPLTTRSGAPICYRNDATCFPTDRCPADVSSGMCGSFCFDPTKDSGTCTGSQNGFNLVWNITVAADGVCATVEAATLATCTAPLQWWPGTALYRNVSTDEASCTNIGYCWPSDLYNTKEDCLGRYFCEGCVDCFDEPTCVLAGQCSDFNGCHLPFNDDGNCDTTADWTPMGCHDGHYNQSACQEIGANWYLKSATRDECLSKAQTCFEQQITGSLVPPAPYYQRPGGVTFKNDTECGLCGGELRPFFQWTQAKWIKEQWTPRRWVPRQFKQANNWVTLVNTTLFEQYHNRSIVRRYSNIVSSNILCRYGQRTQVIGDLACDCGSDRDSNGQCFGGVTKQVVQTSQICNSIPTKIDHPAGYIVVTSDVAVSNSDCADLPITIVPVAPFVQRRQVTLSSVSVSLSQSGKSDQVKFIKNANGVAVGELLGDGVELTTINPIVKGVIFCFTLPKSWTSSLEVKYFDLAFPVNGSYLAFQNVGLELPLDATEACVEREYNSTEPIAFFPAAIIENYESASFIQGLFAGEIFIIFFGILLYLLVEALTIYHLTMHTIDWFRSARTKGFFSLGRIALLILTIVLLIRLLYLFLLPFGVLETSRPADVIFSELPALLFCSIYSVIVVRWAEIYHFTMTSSGTSGFSKLKPVVIAINIALIIIFLVLLILFLTLENPRLVVDCTTTLDELDQHTPTEGVAIAYKVFFALVCVTLSVLFVVYGVRILHLMRDNNATNARDAAKQARRKHAIMRLVIVSAVSAFCLLGQAGNLLHSSFDTYGRNLIGVLVFLYIVELAPAIIFILMFKRGSLFSKYSRRAGFSSRRSTVRTKTVQSSGVEMDD
jgi:hypothetical protein